MPLGVAKEIIVVDDCSADGTSARRGRIRRRDPSPDGKNAGKGRGRAGIALATGDYLIIQDADLEYDPQDYVPMLEALLRGARRHRIRQPVHAERPARESIVGGVSRRPQPQHRRPRVHRHVVTDTVTALKLFRATVIKELPLRRAGSSSITKSRPSAGEGLRIVEVPVSYNPRSKEEGKKIGLRDWFIGTRTFFRFRNG